MRQSMLIFAICLAMISSAGRCQAQVGGPVWDADTLRVHDEYNCSWNAPWGLTTSCSVDVQIDDVNNDLGWFVYSMDSVDGEDSILVELVFDSQGILDWAMVPMTPQSAADWENDALGLATFTKKQQFYCSLASGQSVRGGWGEFWDGYWYYLTNPSAMDDDLETGFYVAGGVGAGAGVIAGVAVAAPVIAGASITIPTVTVTTTTTTGIGAGGVLVAGGTVTTVGTGTVTVSGTTVVAVGTVGAMYMTGGGGTGSGGSSSAGGGGTGGGGITGIRFGNNPNQVSHVFRHIEGIVDRVKTITKITDDLNAAGSAITPGLNIRTVIVDGVTLTYNAFKLPSGVVNVGRIIIP